MRPFNLQQALDGQPLCTTQGVRVSLLAYDPKAFQTERVIVLEEYAGGRLLRKDENGSNSTLNGCKTDLHMWEPPQHVYVTAGHNPETNTIALEVFEYHTAASEYAEYLIENGFY